MLKLSSTILLLFVFGFLNAQTFNGTGGAIPDDGATPTCFNLTVSGVGTINGSYGIASVCLNITHTWDSDLEIYLRAPDGTLIPLSIQNGGGGANYNGTCFTGTATTPITSGTAPFNGNFKAEGVLGNINNGQNANGTWSLCIQDIATGDAGTLNNWNITFNNAPAQPLAPPANDDPCNAVTLTATSTCTYTNYTTEGATGSANADPGCANYNGGDVWFKVTVPAGGALNFDTQTGVVTDGGMAIYSGANCNSLTLISCNDDASANGLMPMIMTTGLTPGSTIWIRIWEYGNDNSGTFGICVTAPTPPPPLTNDDPCTAIPLTANTSCSYTTYTNAGATGTTGVGNPGCASYTGGDIWFSVTVPVGGALTFDTQEGALTDGGMAIYSGSNCNSLTLITCDDDGSSNGLGLMPKIVATGLTPGSTVWVRFWEYDNDNNGTFGICVTIPVPPPTCSATTPAGNTCNAATPICNFNGYCGNTSASYTADYWTELYDAFDACLGGGTSIENNSFISFVASSTSASFNIWVTNSVWGDGIQLMFYEGGCGSGPVTCHGGYNNVIDGPNLISATGLVPGNTYYLMIDGVAGDVCDYTFDPVSGVDALNVNPDVATICAGASINLTASGGNGVYTWSPASGLNTTNGANVIATPAVSTIYTVTSTGTGLCPVTLTKQVYITVTTSIIPTFNPVAPICSGGSLSALPTTSLNGITGTWSPVLNNTTTTTYTFTPTAGQCANTTTLTINVNANTTPTFNPVAAICTGDALSALPTTSLNGITGTWSPALNNTATTTYTFTPAAGQCANTTTLTINVNANSTPTFNPVAAICTGDALSALPTNSLNGITGTWTPALNNTATTTYTFTPTAGQCANTTTLTINVNANTTPTFNPVAAICTGDALSALPTTSLNGITGTWSPALNNTATTTYTFTPAAGQCATPVTLSITVNPKITPTFNPVAAICAGDALSALPTTSLNGITGTWSPALNNTATTTYTFTPAAGQCANTTTLTINVNANTTPTFNPVAPICSGGSLSALPTTSTNGIVGTWTPALNNAATTTYTFTPAAGPCATTTTLTINVNANTTPTFNPVAAICAGDILSALPTASLNGITGTWSPALNNTATTTYTFTPTAGQCANTTTLTITVNPRPGAIIIYHN